MSTYEKECGPVEAEMVKFGTAMQQCVNLEMKTTTTTVTMVIANGAVVDTMIAW